MLVGSRGHHLSPSRYGRAPDNTPSAAALYGLAAAARRSSIVVKRRGGPRWFYAAWAAASMLPLVKGQRTEAEIAAGRDPDCRPVAIGEVDLRAIGRAVTLQVQQPAEAHLAPQQLGVAVKAFIGVPRAVIRDRHAGWTSVGTSGGEGGASSGAHAGRLL